jgi:hypothetical protein
MKRNCTKFPKSVAEKLNKTKKERGGKGERVTVLRSSTNLELRNKRAISTIPGVQEGRHSILAWIMCKWAEEGISPTERNFSPNLVAKEERRLMERPSSSTK